MTVTASPAPAKPAKLPREQDPRNPNHRLAALFDEGTLELISEDDGSGMLAAVGKVEGAPVVAFCSDATVMGGAMGEVGCKAVVHAYERAMADRAPIIGLWHSGGARLAEGVLSLHAVGEIFHAMTQASGKVPQISVVLGPAAGGAAYGPALTDVVSLGPEGRIFVPGPDVVRSVTGEDVDMLRLGGPEPHGRRTLAFVPPLVEGRDRHLQVLSDLVHRGHAVRVVRHQRRGRRPGDRSGAFDPPAFERPRVLRDGRRDAGPPAIHQRQGRR